MYKLYEYKYTATDEIGCVYQTTTSQYLVDANGTLVYSRLNNDGWKKRGSDVKLDTNDENLKFVKNINKEECKKLVFVDNL